MTQTATSQLGSAAIAHPSGLDHLPAPAPELHHLNGDANGQDTNGSPEDSSELTFHDLPPFPEDVPAAPLLRLSLKKLLDHDQGEESRLWRACCDLGFFYLDLRDAGPSKRDSFHSDANGNGDLNGDGLLEDAQALFQLGEEIFELPNDEKQKYDFNDQGSYFGYKGLGAGVVDAKGTRDFNEFYNVSKNDMLNVSERLPAPDVLQKDGNRALLSSYIQRSHAVVSLILGMLSQKLELPSGTLQDLHRLRAVSGDQVRWVRSPPQPAMDAKKLSLGEHTDFGSVTVLFNRLGGLQILPPGGDEWYYVKPLKGHCVVNLGDAMVKFTAGVLRSNIHRVVNPPGDQGTSTRMSLVYFARPEDDIVLKVLDGSKLIDEKRRQQNGSADEEITAKEWILRRALGRRAGGDYAKSHGTESGRIKQ